MDTFQIKNILSKKLGSIFKGAFAREQHPSLKICTPACYVIHTKPSISPDKHGLAVYVCRNWTAVYFFWFGFPPDHTEIIKLLQKHATKWPCSTKMFQTPLIVVCGEYWVVFLLHFHRFKGLSYFLGLFNCDLLENDRQILELVKKSYHLNLLLFISEM